MRGEFESVNVEKNSDIKNQDSGQMDQFDARIPERNMDKETVSETDKPYDPGDRIEETKPEKTESPEKLTEDYWQDLKDKSDCPDTIPDRSFNVSDLKRVPPEVVKQMRSEFNSQKDNLIEEWESTHGMEWPRYTEDVIDENTGNVIRHKGDRYDAHHYQPLSLGGKNEAGNITPVHALDHYDHKGIHATDSPLSKLISEIGDKG